MDAIATTNNDADADANEKVLVEAIWHRNQELSTQENLICDRRISKMQLMALLKISKEHCKTPLWAMVDRLLAHSPRKGIYTTDDETRAVMDGLNRSYLEYMGVRVAYNPKVRYSGCYWAGDLIIQCVWNEGPFPEPPGLPTIAKIYRQRILDHIKDYNFTTLGAIFSALLMFPAPINKMAALDSVVSEHRLEAPGMPEFMEACGLCFVEDRGDRLIVYRGC